VKPGVRAVGIAESFTGETSTLAAVVTRASRVVDGFAFGTCTVGGTDATEEIVHLFHDLDREDVAYLLIAGVAPAWYNILDLERLQRAVDRPVMAVTFEESAGLEPALEREFSGADLEDRLDRYRRLPERHPLEVDGHDLYVRSVGIEREDSHAVIQAFTPEGGRPEPLRLARLAARAADRWQHV